MPYLDDRLFSFSSLVYTLKLNGVRPLGVYATVGCHGAPLRNGTRS